jgi:uncharacterized protein (DUF433 family)
MLLINTKHISTNKQVLSGKPCIKGYCFSLAQLIAEIIDDEQSIKKVCDNFELDENSVKESLQDLAWLLDECTFDDNGNRTKIKCKN